MVIPTAYIGAKLTDWPRNGLDSPWSDGAGPPIQPCDLLLVGNPGSGKTRCMWACVSAWRLNAIVLKAEAMVSQFAAAQSFKAEMTAEDLFETWATTPLLGLDDVGASRTSEIALATILRVLSEREERGLPTIVTTNVGKDGYDPRIQSRLGAYRVLKFPPIDYRKSRGGELHTQPEVEQPVPVLKYAEQVEYWLSLSHAERQSLVDRAKANDPDYWRSYKVPGRCVAPQDQNDRNDCTRFGSCIAQIMLTAQVTG